MEACATERRLKAHACNSEILEPQGDHTISICRGTACHTRGSRTLLQSAKHELGIRADEPSEEEPPVLTTADAKFTVRTVACFGQCALAPVIEIDHRICSHVTERTLRITVGRGTCGRGNGAEGLFHALAQGLDRTGMNVVLAPVGCFGACCEEPIVSVRPPGEPLVKERVHGAGIVPGGVAEPLTAATRDRLLMDLPTAMMTARRTLDFFKRKLDGFDEEIETFGSEPMTSAAMVDAAGNLQLYDGRLRFQAADGSIVAEQIEAEDTMHWIAEASLRDSYMKAPYFRPKGFPAGAYRVGPLARLNAARACGTPLADAELQEFRQRFGTPAYSAFLYHYARLIEIAHALESAQRLLGDPAILDTKVRATAGVNATEGVGMIEAPRGILLHHYKVNEEGAMTWANLIVATGHNNLAIGRSIRQVSQRYIDGTHLTEGMLNRVSAVVRAFDPCLSCSTHAIGEIAMRVRVLGPDGSLLEERSR